MVGQNIGKYRVIDRIGRGGMGTVYRAIDETLHREVAIKVLNAELNDPEVAKRFRAEAITVARLSHPGIATIYELFQHDGQWLMVMEFVRGETLEHMVVRMNALSAQRSAELCMQALAALAHAHSMGVVHRDLKPANLMITETGAVKIMDFGIARVAGTEHLTNAGFMMGTPAYMSPEQVKGQEIDARADLYAMGVVFYRLTTGKLPFKGDTPFAMAQSQVNDPPTPVAMLRSDLPPWVEQVIVRALQKAPEQRFQSAVEFHEAFARCLAGLPLSTMYGTMAGDVLTTPGRPMPTGAITGTNPPLPSAYMSGSIPTAMTPGTGGIPTIATPASGGIPTMLTPSSGGIPTVKSPTTRAGTEAAPAATPATATSTKPVTTSVPKPAGATGTIAPVKRNNSAIIGAAAAVLVAIGVGMYFWLNRTPEVVPPPAPPPVVEATPPPATPPVPIPEPPPPPPSDPPPGTTGAGAGTATPPTAGPPATGTTGVPAGAATNPATAPGRPGGAPIPPVGTPATPGRSTDPPVTGTVPGAGRTGGPPVNDEAASFTSVRFLTFNGRRVDDAEVTVTFGGGQIAVVPKNGGAPIATLPYRRILRATYIRDDNPRWDPALPGPTEKVDLSGMFNRDRHWLTLQTKDSFTLLRLDGDAWLTVLQTYEARTGTQISRPAK
jgi:serine/threonine-protein kinase